MVGRLRNERVKALAEIFDGLRPRLWRIVDLRLDRRLHGRVDVDDVLQEAYLQASARLEEYLENVPVSPFVWLRSITCQKLIDLQRRHLGTQIRTADREVSIHGNFCDASSSACLADILAGSLTSPSVATQRDETTAQLEAALARMDPIDREVLLMRHFEDLSNNEIAEALGLQPSGATMRYTRALRRLKDMLCEFPALCDGILGEERGSCKDEPSS